MWLTFVRKQGANHVVFEATGPFKYADEPQSLQRHMFREVVLPICDLFGVTYEFGERRQGDIEFQHWYDQSVELEHENLIQFDLDPSGPPTVTIREAHKHKERDSDREVWDAFAEEIGAQVIEDAWKVPLTVKERFAIYRTSPVNYFANNGPGAAAIYSNLPAVMCNPAGAHKWIKPGTQYPFSTDRQRMLWGPITLSGLLREHQRWTS